MAARAEEPGSTTAAPGFASAHTSGKAVQSHALRTLFSLAPDELALCFVNIGTAGAVRARRALPPVERYVSEPVLHA